MRKTTLIIIAILWGIGPAIAQDKLLQDLTNSKTAKDRATALINLGEYYRAKPGEDKADLDKAMQYARQALEVSNDPTVTTDAWLTIVRTMSEMGRLPEMYASLAGLNDRPALQAKVMAEMAWQYTHLPGEEKEDLDHAEKLCEASLQAARRLQRKDLVEEASTLKAMIATERYDFPKANQLAEALTPKNKIWVYRVNAQGYANNMDAPGHIDSSLFYLEKAICTAADAGLPDYERSAVDYANKFAYWRPNDLHFDRMFEHLLTVYSTQNYPHKHFIYDALRQLHTIRGNKDKEMYYAQEALREMHKHKDYFMGVHYYMNLGNIYKALSEHQLAYDNYQQALKYSMNNRVNVYPATEAITQALRKMHKYREALDIVQHLEKELPPQQPHFKNSLNRMLLNIYRDMRDYDKAEPYGRAVVAATPKGTPEYYTALSQLGQLYVESQQYEKAKPLLDQVAAYPLPPRSLYAVISIS
ncbi:hypothetical protein MKQ70_11960 [Chitinophaga sedimenti]|uniref:tetratricopeptide repeat protein n=1 Tax=Chitinophaga sedimenti TaxID=2033606 RepID=UPI00200612BC|nr:hypothetical protein [Chitinophaga sedimenti]MCK7555690.1 hypothetical protein [Chitinophaga sedimenti]